MQCPICKIALWAHYAGAGDVIAFVKLGTLDEPDKMPPDIHIFTESKQPWFKVPEGATAMPAFYKRSEHWPAESLARREAALAKSAT